MRVLIVSVGRRGGRQRTPLLHRPTVVNIDLVFRNFFKNLDLTTRMSVLVFEDINCWDELHSSNEVLMDNRHDSSIRSDKPACAGR